MIDGLTILNTVNNKSIVLDKTGNLSFVLDTNGVKVESVSAKQSTYQSHNQIGTTVSSTSIQDRTVSITGYVWCGHSRTSYNNLSNDEYAALQLEEIALSKSELSKVINPLNLLRLTIGDFFIEGNSSSSVEFSSEWSENNEIKCKFTFSIDCNDPMFKYKKDVSTILSGVKGVKFFPLAIPKDVGIIVGERQNYRLISVDNPSDIEVGGTLTLTAKGTVVNPVITDVYSGNTIKINKTLSEGETIVVDTDERTIYGTLNGVTSQYFKYWDFDNTWLQFGVGGTLVGYSADDETYESIDITVSIQSKFYSIGGQ